nr:hypothetical protein [Tanacetum cinerariifolium]
MLPKLSQIVNRLYAFIYERNHSKSWLELPSIVALVMVIDDKSWTLLERHERAFFIGLTKFVDHCKPLVNSAGKIRCPCKSCRIILWVSIKHLSDHIMRHEFDLALLNDLSCIPLNNEHNKPTQRDIGETSNEPTQATCNEFEELYASVNEELYPDCNYVTRLDFIAKFTYFKVKCKLTDSIFNEMLEFFQNVFPISKGYKLPPSYNAIKKTFKTIKLGYESIHACEHNCCLFRGKENKDLDFCLSSHTAKEMIWHATGKYTEPDKMQHLVDGRAWKKFDTVYLDFAKEPINVRLGLAANGFNPFGNLGLAYSMWPVILTTYDLPPWLCMKKSSFMLTLLIPGPKSLGKDIDVYLRPLIEDLKVLWDRKAKPEGLIVEGNVTEEALTFSSHYFRDATMKFNRPDRNVDPPPPTCQFQVFRSICKLIGLRSFICFDDAQELKKVKWYVLHNNPEIDTYWSQFKSLFPNKYMKEEFPDWFGSQIRQRHVHNDKDPKVSTTSELFALACRPTWTPILVNSCVVDGVRYVVHNRDEHRTTQNSGISFPSLDEEMYYDIIDVPNEDNDIIDDEDALPHDLADSDDEDLINVDDDDVDDVARSHDGKGGGEDRPPHHVPTGCEGCFANRAGRLHTCDKTRNLSLKEITDKKGPVLIRFEVRDKQTLMPLGDRAAHWSSYIGEVIRGVPLYYPSWLKVPKERKAGLITDIGTQFDSRPHMESSDWREIDAGIQQHLKKAYNTNKAAFKAQH